MNSNQRIQEKVEIVQEHWDKFPINNSWLPPELEKYQKLWSKSTGVNAIVNSLNNTCTLG